MRIRRLGILVLALAIAGALAACKKKGGEVPAPATPDAAVAENDAPPPPPPAPTLVSREIVVKEWKLALDLPESFEETEPGVFRAKDGPDRDAVAIFVGVNCAGACGPRDWVADSGKIINDAIRSFGFEDADGNRREPQVNENQPLGAGRYFFDLVTPKGDGMLDEPAFVAGVFAFNNEWPAYVSCHFSVAPAVAPTYKSALTDACRSLEIVSRPDTPPAMESYTNDDRVMGADRDAGGGGFEGDGQAVDLDGGSATATDPEAGTVPPSDPAAPAVPAAPAAAPSA